MFTSAASSSVQREQTCLRHPYMLDSNAYVAPTTDEVDVIIGQILTATFKLTTDDTESGEQIFTETDVGDIAFGDSTADNPEELAQWLENYISEACTRRPDEIGVDEFSSSRLAGTNSGEEAAAAAAAAFGEEKGAAH
ncbi:hypothetical protein F511_25074 [Dorcoceras hygrometricum]|uniref:Uncharacterized protein n=1 Tax=Dorcoceras hygrometricum TaxID=472368 RepID=A0A2Z7B3C0_9LAMI|nr:hypothetical protein F511_25074 [Dorcoceras hygrometricum]